MKWTRQKVSFSLLSLYFLWYLNVTLQHHHLLGDTLSLMGSFVVLWFLLRARRRAEPTDGQKTSWMLLILAVGCYIVGDIIWLVSAQLLKMDPSEWMGISLMYGGTNLFFMLYHLHVAKQRIEKWRLIQYVVDAISVTYFTLTFLWLVFFRGDWQSAPLLKDMGWYFTVFILMDAMVLVGATTNFLTLERKSIPIWRGLVAVGSVLYILVDFRWAYLVLYDLYVPNSPVDAFYMLSFLLLAAGAMSFCSSEQRVPLSRFFDPERNLFRWVRITYALINPIVFFLWGSSHLSLLLNSVFFAVFYISMSGYIQVSLRNEYLLRQSQKILEERVQQRTQDLQESRAMYQELARRDVLTHLYNRRYFLETLQHRIENLQEKVQIAILFLDLDRFKTINDTFGHDFGDRVLIEIARRLSRCCPENAFLARLSGDEFICLLESEDAKKQAVEFAETILIQCCEGLVMDDQPLQITGSIGLSVYPEDASTMDQLLKKADMAMYRVKKQGTSKRIAMNADESKGDSCQPQ